MVSRPPARSTSWQDGGMERVLGIGGYFTGQVTDPEGNRIELWQPD
jgi:hypothetical protein